MGSLPSNGKVFLVNPDGILFGEGAKDKRGGLFATTNDIANGDFMAADKVHDPRKPRRLDRQPGNHHRHRPAASPRW